MNPIVRKGPLRSAFTWRLRLWRGTAGVLAGLGLAAAGMVPRAAAAEAGAAGAGTATVDVDSAYEALQRLKGLDIEGRPALKAAVLRVLEASKGTARFVEIVRDFALTNQLAGVLASAEALAVARDPASSDAVRFLLSQPEGPAKLEARLKDPSVPPAVQASLAKAVGGTADPLAIPVLSAVLAEGRQPVTVRSEAVQGLARTEAGARRLLELGRGTGLDESLRTTASLALAQCRWPAVRSEAAAVFPPPKSADGGVLPPPTELARETGDAARGAGVFRSEKAACIRCHRVGDEGVDFGPALSGIGAKLAREALYESILDPSAGISFGYEAWSVETRGGEEVFGILASETGEELSVKQQSGAVVRLKKSDIVRRERQQLSVMPAGLAALLTRRELVDLVEYLAGLKAGGPPK